MLFTHIEINALYRSHPCIVRIIIFIILNYYDKSILIFFFRYKRLRIFFLLCAYKIDVSHLFSY